MWLINTTLSIKFLAIIVKSEEGYHTVNGFIVVTLTTAGLLPF